MHRSGRTARAGASGTVVCFVDKSQRKAVKHIQRAGIDVQVVDPDLDRFGDVQPLNSKPLKAESRSQNVSHPQGRKPAGGQNRNKQRKENVKAITVTTLGVTVMTTNLDAAANLALRANLPLKAKLALRPNLERESPPLVTRESLKAPNEATTTRNPTQNARTAQRRRR